MITLRSFIQAVQEAVISADDALMSKNMDIIRQYFVMDETDEELNALLENAIEDMGSVVGPNAKRSPQKLKRALSSLKKLYNSVGGELSLNDVLRNDNLTPKTVSMGFPTKGADGKISIKEVQVPLLTLVPISFSKVDEVKMNLDLGLEKVDDELQVTLGKVSPAKNSPWAEGAAPTDEIPSKTMQISIRPQEVSDGMQHIIDAYEKVLKSQLPN